MVKLLLTAAVALSALGARAATATTASATPLPELLREVEAKYAKAQTLVAKFSQVVETSLSKQKQTSGGLLMFKRPNRVRWETLTPDPSLFISDGVTAWFYTPPFDEGERGEYHERKASSMQTRLANALLSGSFSMARDMTIKAESAVSFALKPRKKSGDPIRQATIEIDPKERLIRKVTILHRDGNKTEITLSDIQVGKAVDASSFKFTPPPNTDRADE